MQIHFHINIDDRIINFFKNLSKRKKAVIIFTVLLSTALVYAASVTKPFTFKQGDLIVADELNQNFDTLYNKVNALDTQVNTNATNITANTNSINANTASINSLNGNIIYTNETKMIGLGGDFANFILANEWLKDKIICQGATVTLKLTGHLALNTPVSYTWSDGTKAGIYILHRGDSQLCFF